MQHLKWEVGTTLNISRSDYVKFVWACMIPDFRIYIWSKS